MTVVPNLRYVFNGAQWIAPGRQPLPATTAPGMTRDDLVLGTYIPGMTVVPELPNGTVGLENPAAVDTTVERVMDGQGYIFIDSVPTGGVIRNTLYKGKVKVRTTGGGLGGPGQITFRNCKFVNRPPEEVNTSGNANGGCVENFGNNPPHLIFYDCLFDPQWWYDNSLSALKGSPLQQGLHGGNADFYRCEFIHCQDGINYVGPATSAPALAASSVVQGCWIHANYYRNGWDAASGIPFYPSDHQTHSDNFQFNTGRNITIRYNLLGGHRDMVGYNTAPPNGYNSGDDALSGGIMLQQEAGTADYQLVRNVLIENNWVAGADATINLAYKNSNTGFDWTVRNNKIARRGSTQWAGNGYYILYQTGLAVSMSGNVIWDYNASINGTGVAAPVTTI